MNRHIRIRTLEGKFPRGQGIPRGQDVTIELVGEDGSVDKLHGIQSLTIDVDSRQSTVVAYLKVMDIDVDVDALALLRESGARTSRQSFDLFLRCVFFGSKVPECFTWKETYEKLHRAHPSFELILRPPIDRFMMHRALTWIAYIDDKRYGGTVDIPADVVDASAIGRRLSCLLDDASKVLTEPPSDRSIPIGFDPTHLRT